MKDSINILNKLNEDNVIDFNKGKEKLRNKELSKIDPNINNTVESLSIIQVLDNIIFSAKRAQLYAKDKNSFERKYMDDLVSIRDELIYLYQDMFKEED